VVSVVEKMMENMLRWFGYNWVRGSKKLSVKWNRRRLTRRWIYGGVVSDMWIVGVRSEQMVWDRDLWRFRPALKVWNGRARKKCCMIIMLSSRCRRMRARVRLFFLYALLYYFHIFYAASEQNLLYFFLLLLLFFPKSVIFIIVLFYPTKLCVCVCVYIHVHVAWKDFEGWRDILNKRSVLIICVCVYAYR